jgi:hypothetical protein
LQRPIEAISTGAALAPKLLASDSMPLRGHPKHAWKLATSIGGVLLWWTAPAAACIAAAQTYTLDGAYPAPDASNVPTNAPLVLHMVAPPAGVFADGGLTSTPLSDATAHEVVPVIAMALGPRDAQVFSFVPVQPLQPYTTYVVDLGKPPPTSDYPCSIQRLLVTSR